MSARRPDLGPMTMEEIAQLHQILNHCVCDEAFKGRGLAQVDCHFCAAADEVLPLIRRIAELETAIRKHRDASGHNRCWMNDKYLYLALGDTPRWEATLPPRDEFLRRCEEFYALHERDDIHDKIP